MTNEDLCSIFFTVVKIHLKSTWVSEPIIFFWVQSLESGHEGKVLNALSYCHPFIRQVFQVVLTKYL